MRYVLISVLAVFVSILLFASGNTLLGTLASLRLTELEFSTTLIGPILAFYSVGFVAGTLCVSGVIRSVGHIRAASAFAAFAGAAALLHPMTDSGLVWALLRGVVGFCLAGLLVVGESWINDRATNDNRGTLFAVYQVVFYGAAFGGQVLVAFSDPGGYQAFSLTAILVSLALVPLALTQRGAPVVEIADRLSFGELYRVSPVGLTGAFLSGVVLSAFNMMAPAYGSVTGLTVPQVSAFMAVSVAAAALIAWPVGFISDRTDRRRVLAFAAVLCGAAAGGIALGGEMQTVALYALVAVFMGFAATFYPLSVSVTNDMLQNRQLVSASAGLLLCHGLGSCIGPVGGSVFMALLGPKGLFVFLAGAPALLAVYGVARILRTERIGVEEQGTYVPVAAATTPVIAEIDPRNEEFEEEHGAQD